MADSPAHQDETPWPLTECLTPGSGTSEADPRPMLVGYANV